MPSSIPDTPCAICSLPGLVPYAEALAHQYALVERRLAGAIPDTLLLLEHPPTITLGRGTHDTDLLTPIDVLAGRGIETVRVDRGGEITYHAPGQLVGYPILDLKAHGQDLHRYLRQLEDALILTLAGVGVTGERIAGLTGVWVEGRKIAALGIKVSRWVTMHGFALNISLGLGPMRHDFVPCGINDRGVTSLAELLPERGLTRADMEPLVITAFADVFGVRPVFANDNTLADTFGGRY